MKIHDHSELADDLSLLEGVQRECQDCFSLIFRRYCALVFDIAQRILRDRGESEDVLQEVFLAIFEQRYKYDQQRGTVKVWICQFAHFKALMRRRSLGLRRILAFEETAEYEEGVAAELREVADVQAWICSVEQALSHLPDRQRRTIELIHFDGYTLQEACTILSESLANTRNLYYRGMKALRTMLRSATAADPKRVQSSEVEVGPEPNTAFYLGA